VSAPAPDAVLITGAGGQLGRELQVTAPAGRRLVACGAEELDVTRPEMVAEVLRRVRPALVVNAAAFTGVDAAESDEARAHAVNADGAANIAEETRRIGARLIHLSTDFVFDGELGRPYSPGDATNPLSAYGRTKLAGEVRVTGICAGGALIVRTAWVYAGHGRNFVRGMLAQMRERERLGVVADQIGSPTWARSLAGAVWASAGRPELHGIHHWTDAGVASRYDFAVAIQEEAVRLGLLAREIPIDPIRTEDYPAPARRPRCAVLDKTATWAALGKARHWRSELRNALREMAESRPSPDSPGP
jgi:dTDP-4-dehydrorhamnose reductase